MMDALDALNCIRFLFKESAIRFLVEKFHHSWNYRNNLIFASKDNMMKPLPLVLIAEKLFKISEGGFCLE